MNTNNQRKSLVTSLGIWICGIVLSVLLFGCSATEQGAGYGGGGGAVIGGALGGWTGALIGGAAGAATGAAIGAAKDNADAKKESQDRK